MSRSNVLPLNVICLISEYSKPLTRANWRNSKPILSVYELYLCVYTSWDQYDLHDIIYRNIHNTYWYDIYLCIQCFGLQTTSTYYNMSEDELLKINGMKEAIKIYKYR